MQHLIQFLPALFLVSATAMIVLAVQRKNKVRYQEVVVKNQKRRRR